MREIKHEVDFCVIGGGLAGLCAAVAAARRGVKTVLMHDRPVLGGNASSEIRMWVCGASVRGANLRETGLLEEIQLDNLHRNADKCYSVWDSVLYEKAAFQENLTLLLNCHCLDAVTRGSRIVSVKGRQLTNETWHTVEAGLFADCSGDSVLAPLSGAEFRLGREASAEFGETIAPKAADARTMGMSCLIQAREMTSPQTYIPPAWAYKYDEAFFTRKFGKKLAPYNGGLENFWWLEVGGMGDILHDAETDRDELLKIAFGVWDYIKNGPDAAAVANWALEWVGFLPGKRESRRYVGDHILTQNDVLAEGRFEDLVAYGGWSMDDHFPDGFYHQGGCPTIFHRMPGPYGIPYRCLYSKNIDNLFFAGRNISATHAAMSSTRVMATCAALGQAVGTAAAIAVRDKLSPRGVYERKTRELKQALMDDDCYLPWNARDIAPLTAAARLSASSGDPEPLRNGVDRPVGETLNAWRAKVGDHVEFRFDSPRKIAKVRLVFDSDLSRKELNMASNYPLNAPKHKVPVTLVADFRVEAKTPDGQWKRVAEIKDNHQRLIWVAASAETAALRVVIDKTHGAETVNVFAIDFY